MSSEGRPYLTPYLQAAQRHGAGFESLLWASPSSQRARFEAMASLYDFHGKTVLDAGCGRADFLDYLAERGIEPEHYTGIEAVPEMVQSARRKRRPRSLIVQADFVREPSRLLAGADTIVFCGSLNTFQAAEFHRALRAAFEGAGEAVLFNFLSSPRLAHAEWLRWHAPPEVLAFARQMTDDVKVLMDYLDGDCTMAVRKAAVGADRGSLA